MISKYDDLVMVATDEEKERFWSAVRKTDGCWFYEKGFVHPHGYGMFNLRRIRLSAHRVSKLWSLNKTMPTYMACHECSTKNCVRPDHIYWGTSHQNMGDRRRDGTNIQPSTRGEKHYMAVFTNAEVVEIWRKLQMTPMELIRIAKEHNTDSRNIYYIKKKIAWSHLTDTLGPLPVVPSSSAFPIISRKKYAQLTKQQVQIICAMLDAGVSIQDTARHASSCDRTVRTVYYQENGRLPKVRGATPSTSKEWLAPPRTPNRN